MMKALTFLSIFMAAPAFSAEASHFVCGNLGSGETLRLQVGGPRYADAFSVALSDNEIKQLLLLNEQNLRIFRPSLGGNLVVGSCKRGDGNPILVKCAFDPNTLIQAGYSFTTIGKLTEGLDQTTVVHRQIQNVSDLLLEVVKNGTKVELRLGLAYENALQGLVTLKTVKEVGTLNSSSTSCRFE